MALMNEEGVPPLMGEDHSIEKLTIAINLLIDSHNKLREDIKNSNMKSDDNGQRICELSTQLKDVIDKQTSNNVIH